MKNIPIFLVLVLLVADIKGHTNTTEKKTTLHRCFENNLNITENKTITILTGDEKHKDIELKKIEEKRNKDKIQDDKEEYKNTSLRMQRELKTAILGTECISCYSRSTSSSDDNCYSGRSTKTQKCADVEQCFTELHPQYIKRGCTLPLSINRTFVCKCPLCNDKPEDAIYYEYMSISDWEYDNHRLEEPVVGMDLLCRVCDTKGANEASDKKCRLGRSADYMQCGHNELCYTNIDHQIDFVSRGCINKPAFNTMYFFCNESKCNNAFFLNPRKKRSEFVFKTIPMVRAASSANHEVLINFVLLISLLIHFG